MFITLNRPLSSLNSEIEHKYHQCFFPSVIVTTDESIWCCLGRQHMPKSLSPVTMLLLMTVAMSEVLFGGEEENSIGQNKHCKSCVASHIYSPPPLRPCYVEVGFTLIITINIRFLPPYNLNVKEPSQWVIWAPPTNTNAKLHFSASECVSGNIILRCSRQSDPRGCVHSTEGRYNIWCTKYNLVRKRLTGVSDRRRNEWTISFRKWKLYFNHWIGYIV